MGKWDNFWRSIICMSLNRGAITGVQYHADLFFQSITVRCSHVASVTYPGWRGPWRNAVRQLVGSCLGLKDRKYHSPNWLRKRSVIDKIISSDEWITLFGTIILKKCPPVANTVPPGDHWFEKCPFGWLRLTRHLVTWLRGWLGDMIIYYTKR